MRSSYHAKKQADAAHGDGAESVAGRTASRCRWRGAISRPLRPDGLVMEYVPILMVFAFAAVVAGALLVHPAP